jgi:selenocysteine-specific elongation factor
VLDALPLPEKIRPEKITSFLKIMANGSPQEILQARVARKEESGVRLSNLQAEMNLTIRKAAEMIVASNLRLITDKEWVIVSPAAFDRVMNEIVQAVTKFHSASPLESGIGQEELRDRVNLDPEVFYAAIEKLKEIKKLEITGELIRLPGRAVVMKDDEAESKQNIEKAFSSAGLKVPALKDVLAELKVDKARAQKIVTLLLRDKTLVKIADDLVFHREALENLKSTIAKYKTKSSKINVAQFKDLTGVSRKYAIPLLEFLDREHITRRVGDERVIL